MESWPPTHLVHCARVLVRAVRAVGRLVAEERLGDALPVAALQLPIRTHGLVGLQVGQDALRLW